MKIRVNMLKRDRTIATLVVSPEKDHFTYNKGIYSLQAAAVNVTTKDGIVNSRPEIYYIEGIPTPLTPTTIDDANSFLDEVVLKNALKSLAGQPTMIFRVIEDYLKSPTKILLLVFALIIFISFISGMIA